MAYLRYIVDDVEAAKDFYVGSLGFHIKEAWGGPFAMIERGDLVLWLSGPGSSARRAMPDGSLPAPGGWNRLVIEVEAIAAEIDRLRAVGVVFRSDLISGPGGKQIVLEDPSGNPVELFQPA